MTFTLRPNQNECLSNAWNHIHTNPQSPAVISACVGFGKSIVIAKLCEAIVSAYPQLRILNLVHTKELIEQNAAKFHSLASGISHSVYSASLGQKSVSGQVVYAGIQSIYDKAHLARFDMVLIDECHLISKSQSKGMYRQMIDGLKSFNPNIVILGLSGSPYRMDGGSIIDGDERLFDSIIYEYGIRDGLDDGYLSPLILPKSGITTRFNTDEVKMSGLDFNQKALAEVMDDQFLIKQAVEEYMDLAGSRNTHLIFGSGIKHCYHLKEAFEKYIKCEVVTGETKYKKDRDRFVEAHKGKQIPMLINQGVLTTGYDCPHIDSIGLFRATKSVPLYVQIAGRGLRLADGKENCLWVDFTDTTERLGPVDSVVPPETKRRGKKSEAPIKKCFNCDELVAIQLRSCPNCGAEFDMDASPNHNSTASMANILTSYKEPEWKDVDSINARSHTSRKSGKESLRINYQCGIMTYSEWFSFDSNWSKDKLNKFWLRATGGNIPPNSINDAVERISHLKTKQVLIDDNGKYHNIIDFIV